MYTIYVQTLLLVLTYYIQIHWQSRSRGIYNYMGNNLTQLYSLCPITSSDQNELRVSVTIVLVCVTEWVSWWFSLMANLKKGE